MGGLPVEMTDDDRDKDDHSGDDDEPAHLLGGGHCSLGLHVAAIPGDLWSIACVSSGVPCQDIQVTNATGVEEVGVDAPHDPPTAQQPTHPHHSPALHHA